MPFKPLLSLLSAGALAATALAGGALRADPVTLRFEATMDDLGEVYTIGSGNDVSAGSMMLATCTYTSAKR